MFEKLKNMFTGSVTDPVSEKDKATLAGKPYVRVLNTHLNPENPGDGYFELEWNEIFVRELLEAGYTGSDENEIVDQWFTTLCRQIAEEER